MFDDVNSNITPSKNVIFTMIEAAKKRGEQPGHILLYGPEGSGKKFFADSIAQEIGNKTRYIDGSKMTVYTGDMASMNCTLILSHGVPIQFSHIPLAYNLVHD